MKVSLFAGKLALCLLLAACTSKKKNDFTDHKYITGIASVVKLSGDSTLINLEDYVLDISLIDSISTPQSLSKKIDGKQLILKGTLAEKIGTLQLWVKGQAYGIPLQQTFQVPVTFSYDKEANSVAIKGEFNAWNASQTSMLKNGASFTKHLLLNPGRYQYLLVVDGKEKRDPSNKDSVDNGSGGWNSVIQLAKPDLTKLPLMETTSFSEETVELSLSNPADQVIVYWQNFLLDDYKQSATSIRIRIPKEAKNESRSYLRAWAANSEGI
jgi:cyclomaltodextrinase / maltogenic alpha-amylase / neopullulanase